MFIRGVVSVLLFLVLVEADYAGYKNRVIDKIPNCVFGICLESGTQKAEIISDANRDLEKYFTGRNEKLEVSDCPHRMCEKNDLYPAEEIERVVDDNEALHSFFGSVIMPSSPESRGRLEPTLENRVNVGRDEDGETSGYQATFCKSVVSTRRPVKMLDVDNVERDIVNVKRYGQAVQFETCVTAGPGSSCFAHHFLQDYRTQCVQKYVTVQLIYYQPLNGTLQWGKFDVPSTCVCMYAKHVPLDRF